MKQMIPTIRLQKLHDGQRNIVNNRSRFNVLNCGRRFGKTSLSERLMFDVASHGLPVGFWSPTYKDLYEVWVSVKSRFSPIIASKDEQVKQIVFQTGGKIDFWSMDDPDSGRGRKYKRVIVDEAEKAKKFQEAWNGTILPTLLDLRGDAFILSTPKFGQTYFKELFKLGKSGKNDWASFNLSTYSNPHIDPKEIDNLRLTMDDLTFRCEILAEDVDAVNNPFAYAFNEQNHVVKCEYKQQYETMLSFDFNVDPITCIAAQEQYDKICIVKEWAINNGDIYQLCDQINATFPKALFLVTGDATGANRSALTQGNTNYYTVVSTILNLSSLQMRQPRINPSIRDSRVLTNSILQNKPVAIDPSCTGLIRDLKYVQVDENQSIIKDRLTDIRKADFLDTLRYLLQTFYPDFVRFNI